MVSKIQISWLAGVLDGEATFKLTPDRRPKRFGSTLNAGIEITMSHRETIEKIATLFREISGNACRVRKAGKPKKENHLQMWQVAVQSKNGILKVLETIAPYSTTKRLEILLLKFFLEKSTLVDRYTAEESDLEIVFLLSELKHGRGETRVREILDQAIPSRATVALDPVEGVETTEVSANNNLLHERPIPSDVFLLMGNDIVPFSRETLSLDINNLIQDDA